MGTKGDFT